jgi:hypothetical protein
VARGAASHPRWTQPASVVSTSAAGFLGHHGGHCVGGGTMGKGLCCEYSGLIVGLKGPEPTDCPGSFVRFLAASWTIAEARA